MHSLKKRYRGNKPVVETEFVKGDGWLIELVRTYHSRRCAFIRIAEGGPWLRRAQSTRLFRNLRGQLMGGEK